MAVTLNPETQKLIETRLAELGMTSADDLVRMALEVLSANLAVVLSPETEKLIEARLAESGAKSADDLVRIAIEMYEAGRGEDIEDLDAETQAAIEEAMAQSERGEGELLSEFRKTMIARFTENRD